MDRVWKTKEGAFLVERNRDRIPFVPEGVGLPGGPRFADCATYYELSGTGDVLRKYGEPLPCSIDDEMTVSRIHRVIGDGLYRFYWSQVYGRDAQQQVELVLPNLRPWFLPLPFRVDAALSTHEAANE